MIREENILKEEENDMQIDIMLFFTIAIGILNIILMYQKWDLENKIEEMENKMFKVKLICVLYRNDKNCKEILEILEKDE